MDIAARATFRGQVTKLTKAATDYLSSSESTVRSNNAENFDAIEEELVVFIERLTAVRENLLKANNEIKATIKSEDLQKEADASAEYDDKAVSVLARLRQRLVKLREAQQADNSDLQPGVQRTTGYSRNQNAAKLPKLCIKPFSGDFREWLLFWERFKTAIHDRGDLTGADKFNYLQSHLTGKAASSILGFTPSDANYDAAISMLQEEYGNNEKLIDFSMQQLMSLQKVSSRLDIGGLRNLYNSVTSTIRSLTSLGVMFSNYSMMLKTILLKCLPQELTVDFYKNRAPEECQSNGENNDVSSVVSEKSSDSIGDQHVKQILRFLKREVESLEKCAQMQPKRLTISTPKRPYKTAAGLLAPTTTTEPIICFFCRSSAQVTQKCNSNQIVGDKKDMLKRDGRCYRCTRRGHNSKSCKYKNVRCDICGGNHATAVCDPHFNLKKVRTTASCAGNTDSSENSGKPVVTANLCSSTTQLSSDVYLQTACVFLSSTTDSESQSFARIILDGGSQRSYIREDIARKLDLEVVDTINIRILPFGCTSESPKKSFSRVRVVLRSQYDNQQITILAIAVPAICIDILPAPSSDCPMFSQYVLADNSKNARLESGISVLIGADYFWNIVREKFYRISNSVAVIKTIFGWTVQGPVSCNLYDDSVTLSTTVTTLFAGDEVDVERFWDLESLGISAEVSQSTKSDKWFNYVRKAGERYEASLLWKEPKSVLSNYERGAFQRFERLVQKLSRDPQQLLDYDRVMWELISSGVAERVTEGMSFTLPIYYIPHRPVYRLDKATTKIRIVFDASAKAGNNLSLNDCLHTGPNLLPDLLTILLNFRMGKFALVADIEKAFLQISLTPQDRNCHRFFWFEERINNASLLPKHAVYRMNRVTFGVACSPFLLCATLKEHFRSESSKFPQTCQLLQQSFYMDDLVISIDEFSLASQFYKETCEILRRASMNITKWNSNDFLLRNEFDRSNKFVYTQKVLGLTWNCHLDVIGVDLNQLCLSTTTNPTKRNVLKLIARIYDPLGMLGPIIVKLKILFQEIWRRKLQWDEPLPTDLHETWNRFLMHLPLLEDVTMPRYVFNSISRKGQQLHVFCDASLLAYGAVAYIRGENADGQISVSYLCSKNRVAPLKNERQRNLTLPKLELTAALIASRLSSYLIQSLSIEFNEVYLWSDSIIALHWIKNGKRKGDAYVDHRVQEIQNLTKKSEWKHCPGENNPADLLTRGISAKALLTSSIWNNGPSWLMKHSGNWPEQSFETNIADPLLCLQVTSESHNVRPCSPLFDIERYSTYRRVLRVTAYILRFIESAKGRKAKHKFLSALELKQAESFWIRFVQFSEYWREVNALKASEEFPKSSKILTLNPVIDEDNVMRVGTRLVMADYNYDESFPIIIPKSSYFTKLLITDMHERTLHGGVNIVLSRLREKFWIIKGRQIVKTLVKACKVCHRLRGKPISQPFAPLPRHRLSTSRPFETTGIDFAGPLYVRVLNEEGTRKVYILLLTCAVVRAVHLEIVTDMSIEQCLSALRRFFARRGIPKRIISDNARTFKRASLELKHFGNLIESEEFQDFLSHKGVSWEFICERAPWWGGFWERLIKIVKDILKATIRRSTLTIDQLQTLVTEAEAILNARPLTYINDDPLDLSPLTPNHFLSGFFTLPLTSCPFDTTDKDIRDKWCERRRAISFFFKRFKIEYLQRLRSIHHSSRSFTSIVKVGDVVIVYDSSTPRIFWKLAVIERVYPGRDNKIRSCEVRFHNGLRMRRSIQHLFPLEVREPARPEDVENSTSGSTEIEHH